MKVLIVSGSRDHYLSPDERNKIHAAISVCKPHLIVHGACPTGVDWWVDQLYQDDQTKMVIRMPARWEQFGLKAGPRRNGRMLTMALAMVDCGHEASWLAFPRAKSRGTRNFIKKAQESGLPGEIIPL